MKANADVAISEHFRKDKDFTARIATSFSFLLGKHVDKLDPVNFEYNDNPYKKLMTDSKRMHDDHFAMKGEDDEIDPLEQEMKSMAEAMTLAQRYLIPMDVLKMMLPDETYDKLDGMPNFFFDQFEFEKKLGEVEEKPLYKSP